MVIFYSEKSVDEALHALDTTEYKDAPFGDQQFFQGGNRAKKLMINIFNFPPPPHQQENNNIYYTKASKIKGTIPPTVMIPLILSSNHNKICEKDIH